MTVLNKNSHLALFCSTYFRTYLFLQLFKNKHCLFTIIERNRATQNKTRIIKKAGQFVFKSVTLACQHLYSCFFLFRVPTGCAGEAYQCTILQRIMQSPGNHTRQDRNNQQSVRSFHSGYLLMYIILSTYTSAYGGSCRYLSDSGYPVNSWDLIFLFLHLISKYCWLHSHKLL